MAPLFAKMVRDGLIDKRAMWDKYLSMCNEYGMYPIWYDRLTIDPAGMREFFDIVDAVTLT